MNIDSYCSDINNIVDASRANTAPWTLVAEIEEIVRHAITKLGPGFTVSDEVAIHQSAKVDETAIIKAPAIVGPDCFIGPHSLLRAGVYLQDNVSVGPSCELKHCLVGKNTSFAHFNFIGDSIIGSGVNLEAGAIIANHYNEREDKAIFCVVDGNLINTGATKFGSLIGDDSKLGANAVTSPGTILKRGSIVKRLELVEQVKSS